MNFGVVMARRTIEVRKPRDIGDAIARDCGCTPRLALGTVPGDRTEGVDDEGDELVAGHRSDLLEPSQ